MSNPFDFVNSILQEKNPVEDKAEYIPFLTNRSLSYHYDTILHANEMNMNSHIDKEMQYDYFFNSVRKYKRPFRKWHKEVPDQTVNMIKEYYSVSTSKAREYLKVLSKDNLLFIEQKMQKGGLNK